MEIMAIVYRVRVTPIARVLDVLERLLKFITAVRISVDDQDPLRFSASQREPRCNDHSKDIAMISSGTI